MYCDCVLLLCWYFKILRLMDSFDCLFHTNHTFTYRGLVVIDKGRRDVVQLGFVRIDDTLSVFLIEM